jgi:hypothetical protein
MVSRTREVRDPSGEHWFVRLSKRSTPPELIPDPFARNPDPFFGLPFGIVLGLLLGPILWFVTLPLTAYRALFGRRPLSKEARVRRVWIQASTMYGQRNEKRFWLVTGSEAKGPFEEIVAGLERGRLPQPAGAELQGIVRG